MPEVGQSAQKTGKIFHLHLSQSQLNCIFIASTGIAWMGSNFVYQELMI